MFKKYKIDNKLIEIIRFLKDNIATTLFIVAPIIVICLFLIVFIYKIIILEPNTNNEKNNAKSERFEEYYIDNGFRTILVDKETDICYLETSNGITVILDTDGKPKLWNGD